MKVRIRTGGNNVENFHENKKRKIIVRLTRTNDNIRRNQLAEDRSKQIRAMQKPGDFNIAGNKRGLHLRDVPPEEASERGRKMRAMRRFYNRQMPVMQCNGCAYSAQCPQFKAGYECAFLPFLNSHKVESVEDLFQYMKEMAGANMRRTQWALTAETLSGGAPSLETSEAFNLAFTQLKQLYEIATKSDSTMEIETDDVGVIGEIFGNLANLVKDTKQAQAEPIDITPTIHRPKKELLLTDRDMNDSEVNVDLATEFARDEILSKVGRKKVEPLPEISVSDVRKSK